LPDACLTVQALKYLFGFVWPTWSHSVCR
jgi:hypothetical protein